MSFSMLTPIMPLFLPVLGVKSASAVALWAGILAGITSFVAAFASPLWGRLADRHGRKLMLLRSSLAVGLFAGLMGASGNVWQVFACSRADGRLCRVFEHRDRTGREPGARRIGSALRSAGSAPASSSARWSGRCSAARWPMRPAATASRSTAPRRRSWCRPVSSGSACTSALSRRRRRAVGRAVLNSLIAVARSPGLLALFFVLLMAQFGVRTVQPVVTLFVKELLGDQPNLATLSGIAFSITGARQRHGGAVSRQ